MGVTDTVFLLQTVRDQLNTLVYPVQRLDRGTSGVVGFGLSKDGATELQKLLQAPNTCKYYITLVRGRLEGEGRIDTPLRNPQRGMQTALTLYRTLASCEFCSLLQVQILTGRFHQIRKHMSAIGHPIIGDFEEGKSLTNNLYRQKYGLNRPFLHAARLDLGVGQDSAFSVVSNLPSDLSDPLKCLAEEFEIPNLRLQPAFFPSQLSRFIDDQRNTL